MKNRQESAERLRAAVRAQQQVQTSASQQSRERARAGPGKHDIHVAAVIAGGAAALAVAAWLFCSTATAVCVTVIALATIQGVWYGFARVVAGLLGALAAVLVAPPLGRALEGVIGPAAGLGGLAARGVSVVAVGVLVLVVVTLGLRAIARRFFKDRLLARFTDRVLGAGAGFVQGTLIAVLLLWAPLSLEPVFRGEERTPQDAAAAPKPVNPGAGFVQRWADEVRESSLAPLARATNPLPDTRWLTLLRDFAKVSRDREALRSLIESDAMKKIADLPSVRSAMERMKADPRLASIVESQKVNEDDVLAILNSPTVLAILESTNVVEEFEPLAPELEKAIAEAARKVK